MLCLFYVKLCLWKDGKAAIFVYHRKLQYKVEIWSRVSWPISLLNNTYCATPTVVDFYTYYDGNLYSVPCIFITESKEIFVLLLLSRSLYFCSWVKQVIKNFVFIKKKYWTRKKMVYILLKGSFLSRFIQYNYHSP